MSLVKNFNKFPIDQFTESAIVAVLHPTKPLVLLEIEQTSVMMGLDEASLHHLIHRLVDCHSLLLARLARNPK